MEPDVGLSSAYPTISKSAESPIIASGVILVKVKGCDQLLPQRSRENTPNTSKYFFIV
jgi:hypothetical protein